MEENSREEKILRVEGLGVAFGREEVLSGVSFDVNRGEAVAVIGPNGAGKTVLFRTLLGLLPYSGLVVWSGGVKIGYVPQRFHLEVDLPLTTEEFFGLKNLDSREAEEILKEVGFKGDESGGGYLRDQILKRKLGVLSGGELQRVMIAWALVGGPDVLLFDEPTGGVDMSGEETIYGLLHKLQERNKLTIMIISHDLQMVYRYATKIICLNRKKLCSGTPEEAMTKEVLGELFGKETAVFLHKHGKK